MANYLVVCLSLSTRTWHLRLHTGSVQSWNHLHRLFTSNFCATCVDQELTGPRQHCPEERRVPLRVHPVVLQQEKHYPRGQRQIDNYFFKKGLREPSLIQNLAIKNPRTSEEMFYITNRYGLAEEVTLDTREQKESCHTNQPSSSKGHDKKRKVDHSINMVEWPSCHKEYRPRPGKFKGFLDRICIFHPQGKHKTRDYDRLQGFADEILKMTQAANQEKKPKDPKCELPKAHKGVNYIFGGPGSYEPKGKLKLTARGGHRGQTYYP
jgi:hypothetical protein